jgi:hypothetical protein
MYRGNSNAASNKYVRRTEVSLRMGYIIPGFTCCSRSLWPYHSELHWSCDLSVLMVKTSRTAGSSKVQVMGTILLKMLFLLILSKLQIALKECMLVLAASLCHVCEKNGHSILGPGFFGQKPSNCKTRAKRIPHRQRFDARAYGDDYGLSEEEPRKQRRKKEDQCTTAPQIQGRMLLTSICPLVREIRTFSTQL